MTSFGREFARAFWRAIAPMGLGVDGAIFLPKVWRADDVARRLIWASGSPPRSLGTSSTVPLRILLTFQG
jgi:hypothetical protein